MAIGSGVYGYLSYVFLWDIPDAPFSLLMIIFGGAAVLAFVFLSEFVTYTCISWGSTKWTPLLYQLARAYLMVCATLMLIFDTGVGMAAFDGLKGRMVPSGTSTTNSKELIWNYWVSGRNFRNPVDVLSYSIVHTPAPVAPVTTTPAPAT